MLCDTVKTATPAHRLSVYSRILRYGTALGLVVSVGAVRQILAPPGSVRAPFLFFYPAIGLAAFLGGAGPGFVALAACALWAGSLFVFENRISWAVLAIVGPLVVAICARIRYTREKRRTLTRESLRFRFISDNASDWIFLITPAGTIQYANTTAARQLGFTADDLTGRPLEDFVPDSQKEQLRSLAESFAPESPPVAEITFRRRDQSHITLEVGCAAVKTGDETVVHVAGRNVSERRQLEQNLRDARHWESLGVLAGGLAHDFNNLLMTILGNAALARECLADPGTVVDLLEGVERAGDRCAELVRLMLATAAYRPRHSEVLHVDRILNMLVATRALPPGTSVMKAVSCDAFHGDRNSIETLLWSLVVNSAESYGDGAGPVEVCLRSGEVPYLGAGSFEEGETPSGPCLGIVVEDNGYGMTRDVLDRAFDPFFTTKFTGRGLGLPAVRGIVRAYSGKLWVRTAPGAGTRVEVWLPAGKT